jgi:hypothetical protein
MKDGESESSGGFFDWLGDIFNFGSSSELVTEPDVSVDGEL